jgi:hypothetical protein
MPNIHQVRRVLLKSPAAVAASGFDLSYQSSLITSTTATPITYAGLTWAAGATRTVCVIQYINATTPAISAVTINGTACSQVSGTFLNNGEQCIDIWVSDSPVSGTSGSVVVTYGSNNSYRSAVGLYNLTTTTVAPGTADTSFAAASSLTLGAVTIPSGGGAVFGAFAYLGATITSPGGNAVIDASLLSGGLTLNFGHTTATGSQSVGLTFSASDNLIGAVVPWGP